MLGLLLKHATMPEIRRAFSERFETSTLLRILAWRDHLLIPNGNGSAFQRGTRRNLPFVILLIDSKNFIGRDRAVWEWQRVLVKTPSPTRHQVVRGHPL